MDARIGQLNGGKFYAFANGYNAPEVVGTLEQVEVALGLREAIEVEVVAAKPVTPAGMIEFTVHVQKKFPAWDEVDGYDVTVWARTKAEANRIVRNDERREGMHIGDGQVYYSATLIK